MLWGELPVSKTFLTNSIWKEHLRDFVCKVKDGKAAQSWNPVVASHTPAHHFLRIGCCCYQHKLHILTIAFQNTSSYRSHNLCPLWNHSKSDCISTGNPGLKALVTFPVLEVTFPWLSVTKQSAGYLIAGFREQNRIDNGPKQISSEWQ
jgi:hypothetical protein